MSKVFSLIWTLAIAVAIGVILMICSEILPDSPFQQFLSWSSLASFSQYLKFVFYFVPAAKIIAVMEAWVLCMTNWYTFRIVYKIADHVVSGLSSPINALMGKM
jgi:hypothetical protein